MLSLIITIYVVAFAAYWGFQLLKASPVIVRWLFLIVAIPVLMPVSMIKSLPQYLKPEGRWYGYRWVVYSFFALVVVNIILLLIAPTPV